MGRNHLVLQSRCEILLVSSLVVASAGSGLMAAAPVRPVEYVAVGMGRSGESCPESSDLVAGQGDQLADVSTSAPF
jgi:hypothetical protein